MTYVGAELAREEGDSVPDQILLQACAVHRRCVRLKTYVGAELAREEGDSVSDQTGLATIR